MRAERNRLGELVTTAVSPAIHDRNMRGCVYHAVKESGHVCVEAVQIAKQCRSQQRCLWQCSLYRARFSLLRASNSFIRCADRNATLNRIFVVLRQAAGLLASTRVRTA